MSKRPNYGEAVLWLIANESLDWLDDLDPGFPDTVLMASELFGVAPLQMLKDIRATLENAKPTKRRKGLAGSGLQLDQ
jgi:hypothetical protein